jgi:hypothetical protein
MSLIRWLGDAAPDTARGLLLSGNAIGREIGESALYVTWLGSVCRADHPVEDPSGLGNTPFGSQVFMTHEDGMCLLASGCPQPTVFDDVGAAAGVPDAFDALDYNPLYGLRRPAGAAYVEPTTGYRTVTLGFGIEYMRDGEPPGVPFLSGAADRADLLGNILEFFGKEPTETPTVVPSEPVASLFSEAYPNPSSRAASVAYTVATEGRVTVAVYDVAGRLVAELLDEQMPAGMSGRIAWDGRDKRGRECGSGVYFVRIAAPGLSQARKVVILR